MHFAQRPLLVDDVTFVVSFIPSADAECDAIQTSSLTQWL